MKQSGFTLPEMLIALAIGSVLMLGIARFLPALQINNLRTLMSFQLHEELKLMINTLEKAVRRAGYCAGECEGKGIIINTTGGTCLLVRWDENSNGKWEGPDAENSDYYGYRLREGNLEVQRGVSRCDTAGWEKLNDPGSVTLSQFQVTQADRQIRLLLSGYATAFPGIVLTVESWITAKDL